MKCLLRLSLAAAAGLALFASARTAHADDDLPPLPASPPTTSAPAPAPPPSAPPPPVVTTRPVPPPAPSVPPAVAPPGPHDEPVRAESGFVEVRVDADQPGVYLEALTEKHGFIAVAGRWRTHVVRGVAYHWEPVCAAPCARRVPPNLVYRVAGPRIPASDEFTVGPPGGATDLHVKAGSLGGRAGGAVSLSLGIPTALVGVVLLAIEDDTRTAGIITTGVGVGLIALGAVLIATSSTDVANESGRVIAERTKADDTKLFSRVKLTPTGLVF